MGRPFEYAIIEKFLQNRNFCKNLDIQDVEKLKKSFSLSPQTGEVSINFNIWDDMYIKTTGDDEFDKYDLTINFCASLKSLYVVINSFNITYKLMSDIDDNEISLIFNLKIRTYPSNGELKSVYANTTNFEFIKGVNNTQELINKVFNDIQNLLG